MTVIRHLATIFTEASLSTSTYVSPPVPSTVYPPSAPRVLPPYPRVPPTPRVPTLPQRRAQVPHIIPPDNAMQPEYHNGVFPQPFVLFPIVEPDFHAITFCRYPTRDRRQSAYCKSQYAFAIRKIAIREANSVIDANSGPSLNYRQLSRGPDKDIWIQSLSNDLGCLAQVVGNRIEGTNTIFFISKSKVPCGRTVTYGSLVSTIRPHKEEKFRTCVTVGGNKLPYPGPTYTKTAGMKTIKILLDSTISLPGARFMTLDLKKILLYSHDKVRIHESPFLHHSR